MNLTNNKLVRYLKESREELRKVIWPARRETIKHTLLVIGISVALAIFLGVMDFFLNLGLQNIVSK